MTLQQLLEAAAAEAEKIGRTDVYAAIESVIAMLSDEPAPPEG